MTAPADYSPRTPQAIAEAHPCPVPGCDTLVSPGHIACTTCWCRVPRIRRSLLVPAFRRREQDELAFACAVGLAHQLVLDYAR